MNDLIYLASPYSHADQAVVLQRFEKVCQVAASLMSRGHLIFSPIAHTHPIAMAGKLETHWDFWQRYDRAMLDACGSLWVLMLPDWGMSVGIANEVEYMRRLRKPVAFLQWHPNGHSTLHANPPTPEEWDSCEKAALGTQRLDQCLGIPAHLVEQSPQHVTATSLAMEQRR